MKVKKRKAGKVLWRVGVWGLLLGALATEYRKPPGERTGTGLVAGVVPYDFRAPTVERFKYAMWNPKDSRIVVPHPFGVGWTVNLGRLWALWQSSADPQIEYSREPLE